jgi:hypothetical protein
MIDYDEVSKGNSGTAIFIYFTFSKKARVFVTFLHVNPSLTFVIKTVILNL